MAPPPPPAQQDAGHPAADTTPAQPPPSDADSPSLTLPADQDDDPFSYIPNVIAAFARSFAQQSMMALTGFSKGMLKWWFRVPVKLFRPSVVNPFLIFAAVAEQQGRRVSVDFVRSLVKVEGTLKSIVGAVLFNTYSISMSLLATEVPIISSENDEELTYEVKHHPFTAGALAGAAQSLLATPLDNITRRVDPAEVAARRGEGLLGVMAQTAREAMPKEGGKWAKFRFLYNGYGATLAKDSMGFSLFFGLFETTRRMGKRFVADLHETNNWPKRHHYPTNGIQPTDSDPKSRPSLSITLGSVTAVVGAGSLAGMGYQLVAYPFDRVHQVMTELSPTGFVTPPPSSSSSSAEPSKPDWRAVWNVVRTRGVAPFYRGIGAQLVRVAPPSAVGLLIFEIANSHLWEEEDG
ncbi:hypothetical protein HDU67_005475 [Dinochytrium kinnereticum]|nr:hypothetical protein HDU67_005475 [Dinochytrium kinnereticum]